MNKAELRIINYETEEKSPFSSRIIYGILDKESTEFFDIQQEIKNKKAANPSLRVIGIAIDILRASTTITYLLAMGAKHVIVSDLEPAKMKDIVKLKNLQGKKYIDIGSDASGNVIFTLPNSPYEVIKNRNLVKGSVPIINTSKGAVAAINALDAGCDEVLFASLPTFSATLSYIEKLIAQNDVMIYCFATEGNLNESLEPTEDALYADALSSALRKNVVDQTLLQDKIYNNRGSQRFFRGKTAFPSEDIVLTIQPPDTYNFVSRATIKLGQVITNAMTVENQQDSNQELIIKLKNLYEFSEYHPVIVNLRKHYPDLAPNKIIDKIYLSHLRHRNLLKHVISLIEMLLNICKINNIDIKTAEELLLLVLYHDAAKIISSEEIDQYKFLNKGHSKIIQTLFESIGEKSFAHNLRHNSIQFVQDLQNNTITLCQLLLNICDRLDISGNKTNPQKKFDHVIHQHGKRPFDIQAELKACHTIDQVIDHETLILREIVVKTILQQ